MRIEDEGLIIKVSSFGESSLIIKVLSKSHGIISGLVKSPSRQKNAIYVIGNTIKFIWVSRIIEQLGNINGELLKSYSYCLYNNVTKYLAFSSITSILIELFKEGENIDELYYSLTHYIDNLFLNKFCFIEYFFLELELIGKAGYKLDLSKCAVTGSAECLEYLSPRSGRAVSKMAGEEFSSKLLRLPQFIIDKSISKLELYSDKQIYLKDITIAEKIISYFILRYTQLNDRPLNNSFLTIERENLFKHLLS